MQFFNLKTKSGWKYVSVIKEIMNALSIERVRYIGSLDFNSAMVGKWWWAGSKCK